MDIYNKCPETKSKNLFFRLIEEEDYRSLYECYHDDDSVALMNDDNCDFGFYVETEEQMKETIKYWIDFYKKRCFVRFSIVDLNSRKAIGTIEGFSGDIGVLRIDLASAYEKTSYINEILDFAKHNFFEYFGNKAIVTKAIDTAVSRRIALEEQGFEYIGDYRNYSNYYRFPLKK